MFLLIPCSALYVVLMYPDERCCVSYPVGRGEGAPGCSVGVISKTLLSIFFFCLT